MILSFSIFVFCDFDVFKIDTMISFVFTVEALCILLDIEWFPCYCHVMILLMEDIVTSSNEHIHLLFSLDNQLEGKPFSAITFLLKVQKHLVFHPTLSLRWNSLYKLLKNVHILRPHIESFMACPDAPNDEIGEIPIGFCEDVKRFLETFAIAKSAMEKWNQTSLVQYLKSLIHSESHQLCCS